MFTRISWQGRAVGVCAHGAAVVSLFLVSAASAASADTFGTGANQFTIDFVTISGAPDDGYGGQSAGSGFTTTNIAHDYRMGLYEITNEQWNKFESSLGVPITGVPSNAYGEDAVYEGKREPVNMVSWYEAAQFVNWLNTSTGHQAAYKFTGTQGTVDYALATWSAAEADNGTNLYRHKDAKYYLPTEDEWVKAAYWNGTGLQMWATPDDKEPFDDEANYNRRRYASLWDVGSGSEELNGTYDMMGNVWEWMESPYTGAYCSLQEGIRGGSFDPFDPYAEHLRSSYRYCGVSDGQHYDIGFRVASDAGGAVPEPMTMLAVGSAVVGLGGYLRRRR